MFRLILVIGLCVSAVGSVGAQQASVSLSRVDPPMGGQLPYDYPISFYFRVANPTTYEFDEIANGFRIYSPDGAKWNPGFTVDTLYWPGPIHGDQTLFDTTWYGEFLDEGIPNIPGIIQLTWRHKLYRFGYVGVFWEPIAGSYLADGLGADTMWFFGSTENVYGLLGIGPTFFADPAWVIRVTSIDHSSLGKTVCIDSSFYRPSGKWVWSTSGEYGDRDLPPAWDGPHCFEVVDCCVGRRGNVDLTYSDLNIADLTALIRQVFVKSQLRCPAACNVDGDSAGTVDIVDLVYLTDYMFRGGPEPAACP